jgi:hypothetical protein
MFDRLCCHLINCSAGPSGSIPPSDQLPITAEPLVNMSPAGLGWAGSLDHQMLFQEAVLGSRHGTAVGGR